MIVPNSFLINKQSQSKYQAYEVYADCNVFYYIIKLELWMFEMVKNPFWNVSLSF